MRTRQKTRTEDRSESCHAYHGAGRLDLKMDKNDILKDIKFLTDHTNSEGLQNVYIHIT